MTYRKGRLRLEDFNKIHDYNELDLAKLIREQAQAAEKQAAAVIDQAKELAAKVTETVQSAVGNLLPGEQR